MATHGDEVKIQNRQEADSAKAKRKRCLTALTLLFALAAAAAGSAFFLWWQHEEETEDAYVAGRVVQVTPQKGGTVRKVLHDDTDAVKKGDVLAALAEESSARAALGGQVSLREQPAVQTAIGRLKDAWLNLQRTQIRAPADGQVAKRSVQVGQQVAAGAPLMAVVPLSDVWVDANFKETQLRHMKIGQPAELVSDLYGKQIVYRGRVAGFSAGTGSAFSLIPAQNATGNWIKVVQRVPVRIVLNREDVDRHPLRIGLSMTVKVDTSAAGAPVSKTPGAALPEMESTDWSEVDRTVDEILGQSAP